MKRYLERRYRERSRLLLNSPVAIGINRLEEFRETGVGQTEQGFNRKINLNNRIGHRFGRVQAWTEVVEQVAAV